MSSIFKFLISSNLRKLKKINRVIITISVLLIISLCFWFIDSMYSHQIEIRNGGWKLSLVTLISSITMLLFIIASDVVPLTNMYLKKYNSINRAKKNKKYRKYQKYFISGIENIIWFLLGDLCVVVIFYYSFG